MKIIDFKTLKRNLPDLVKSISENNLRILVKLKNEKDLVIISRNEFNLILKTINS